MTDEVLNPLALILPKLTTAERNTLVAEEGTIIYNTSTNKINFCLTAAAGAGNWEAVTSS